MLAHHSQPDVAGERLLRPWVGVSVCLLVLNDHYLKQSHPCIVTGKLSDFAGLLFFPVFLQALWELAQRVGAGRVQHSEKVQSWCAWSTVATFTGVKITPWGGSIGFGASWPLGKGWLLGWRLRLTGLGTPWGVLPVDAPASFVEAALLVGFSFQSP